MLAKIYSVYTISSLLAYNPTGQSTVVRIVVPPQIDLQSHLRASQYIHTQTDKQTNEQNNIKP